MKRIEEKIPLATDHC